MSEVQFDLVADNEIPIVMFDSGKDYQGVVSRIGTDNLEAGRTAGSKLGDAVNSSGKVALFMKDSKSTSSKERETGMIEALKESYPEVEVVDIYREDELEERSKEIAKAEQEEVKKEENKEEESKETVSETVNENNIGTDHTEEQAAEKENLPEVEEEPMTDLEMVKYILEKNPDLAGCASGNEEMTELLLQAKDELGLEELKVIGFDGSKKLITALEDGKIDGLILQNPFGMGYATVVAASRAILGEANEASVDSSYVWITKDNLEDESIQNMLY